MLLKPNVFPLTRRKSVYIVHVPTSLRSDDVLDALIESRTISMGAERLGCNFEIEDISTMLLPYSQIAPEVALRRMRQREMLEGQVFSAIYYSGSGLSSEYLREIVRAAYCGDTPVKSELPSGSTLARYLRSFRYDKVNRVE